MFTMQLRCSLDGVEIIIWSGGDSCINRLANGQKITTDKKLGPQIKSYTLDIRGYEVLT